MRKTTSRKSRFFMSFVGLFVLTAFLGCAGGQWKSTTTAGGKTTVYGDAKTIKKEQQKQEYAAARIENIRKAEKRKPTDPIVVALFKPTIGDKLKKSIDQAKLFQQLRKEFEQDSIIRLVDQKVVDSAQKSIKPGRSRARKKAPQVAADISVFTNVYPKQVAGKSRATGKVGMMAAIVFAGRINSHYLPEDKFKAEERGNIFQNVQVTKKYAAQVKEIIKTKVTIPGEAYKNSAQDEKKAAFKNWLNSFKKKE